MAAISLIPENLHDLIAQGEGQGLEFKRSLAELETGARSVTAMANADGGSVVFGVRDDGTILGMEIGAQTRERVVQAITANTDPTLYPSVEVVKLDEQTIILVTVPESQDKPHLVQGRAYKRVGATDGAHLHWPAFLRPQSTAFLATRRGQVGSFPGRDDVGFH